METFLITSKLVQFWTYRTARVIKGCIFSVNDYQATQIKKYLEHYGKHIDNHICWKTENGLYYMYSDSKLYIGNEILIEKW